MAEQVTLTAPEQGVPATPRYLVAEVTLRMGIKGLADETVAVDPAGSKVMVKLVGDYGHIKTDDWEGQEAHNDIVALNKANCTVQSLHKRVMNRLIQRGTIAGNVTGTPE